MVGDQAQQEKNRTSEATRSPDFLYFPIIQYHLYISQLLMLPAPKGTVYNGNARNNEQSSPWLRWLRYSFLDFMALDHRSRFIILGNCILHPVYEFLPVLDGVSACVYRFVYHHGDFSRSYPE